MGRNEEDLVTKFGEIKMEYTEIKSILKTFLMNQYDIRPSLAERAVEVMFIRGAEFISLEEQKEKENGIQTKSHN